MWNDPDEFDVLTAASLAAVKAAAARPAGSFPLGPPVPVPKLGGDWEPFGGTPHP